MSDSQQPDVLSLEAEAYNQGGYFTAGQARAHAVSRQLLAHHVSRGRFERVRRGLYRVQGYPTAEHDDMREAWMAVGGAGALLGPHHCATRAGSGDRSNSTVAMSTPEIPSTSA